MLASSGTLTAVTADSSEGVSRALSSPVVLEKIVEYLSPCNEPCWAVGISLGVAGSVGIGG